MFVVFLFDVLFFKLAERIARIVALRVSVLSLVFGMFSEIIFSRVGISKFGRLFFEHGRNHYIGNKVCKINANRND